MSTNDAKFSGPPLRAAVIGTGKISEEHLRFLSSSPHAQLVGVCDLSQAMATFAASRFKSQAAYTDASKMLAEAKPDVVHVLTPAMSHPVLVRDCLLAGTHVIVEKPVAPTHREFLELWELAKSSGKRLVEDHNYRFNRTVQAIERLVAKGELGDVLEVEVRMSLAIRAPGGRYVDANLPHSSHSMPCGVLHEFITHLCYLALRFMPSVEQVRAAWIKRGCEPIFKYDELDALIGGGSVRGRIRFTSQGGPDEFFLAVRGTRGFAQTDLFQPYLRVVVPRRGKQLSGMLNHVAGGWGMMWSGIGGFFDKIMQRTAYEGLASFLTKTYAALSSGQEPPVTFDDMDRVSRLIDTMLEPANRI